MPVDARVRFYTSEKLGDKQSLTPEGFLLCEDVPIARTGTQTYGPGETPVEVGPDGVVIVERTPDEVFRPETIASINGKPLVNDHPDEWVSPDNWRSLSLGVWLNPRRGVGAQDDMLLADLLVTDAEAIRLIREEGKREVSLGYDAEYISTAPGRAKQTQIVVNHGALVDSARCGNRCSIGDSAPKGEINVAKKHWMDRVRDAFKSKDEKEMEEALKESKDSEDPNPFEGRMKALEEKSSAHDNDIKALTDRVSAHDSRHAAHDAAIKALQEEGEEMDPDDPASKDETLEGDYEAEAPKGTGDAARRAKDSAYFQESFSETVALAEVIAPGIRLPKYTRDAAPKSTLEQICGLRRKAISFAVKDAASSAMIEDIRGGRSLDEAELAKMTCGQTRDLFRALGAMKKKANDEESGRNRTHVPVSPGGLGVTGAIRTAADLNKKQSEFWNKRPN